MRLTQQQIKTLTEEKCSHCEKGVWHSELGEGTMGFCGYCDGTGLPTIEIEKEFDYSITHKEFMKNGKKKKIYKIPKYKVGDNFYETIDVNEITKYEETTITITKRAIKLKIISETEDKQKIQMVR